MPRPAPRAHPSSSVQLYSVRDHFAADPGSTLQRLADLGFRHVEPYAFITHADALDAALRSTGLSAPSGHIRLVGADHAAVFDTAQRLGIGLVFDPAVPADRWRSVDDIRRTADALNDAAAAAAPYGDLRIGYHNHAWEMAPLLDGRIGLDHLVEHLEPDVVLEIDAFWVAAGGQDPAELLTRLGDRVRAIHVKDGPLEGTTEQQQPLGHGSIDIAGILRAAPRLELAVIEFDGYSGDVFDAIDRSRALLDAGLLAEAEGFEPPDP